IVELENSGFRIRFMYISNRKFQPEWEEKYPIQVVGDFEGYRYFLNISRETVNGEKLVNDEMAEAEEVVLPRISLQQINDEMKEVNAVAESLQDELHTIVACCSD